MTERLKKWLQGCMCIMIALCCSLVVSSAARAADVPEDTVTVDRTADLVFVIDRTGSMSDDIRGVRDNIEKFLDKMEQEEVDIRVRFITFRNCDSRTAGSYYKGELCVQEDLSPWYTNKQLDDARNFLSNVKISGGGYNTKFSDGETYIDGLGLMRNGTQVYDGSSSSWPALNSTDYGDNQFFARESGKQSTIAKFCVLMTDEGGLNFSNPHGFSETESYTNDPSGLGKDGKKPIINWLREKQIHCSLVYQKNNSSHVQEFANFPTPPSVPSGDDGGMEAQINGNYDILIEKLAEKVIEVTKQKQEEVVEIIKQTQASLDDAIQKLSLKKPVKVRANMIVLRKEAGKQYSFKAVTGSSLEWSPWQDSCVFKNLQPSTSYQFKVKDKSAEDKNANCEFYYLQTESSTGARFGSIPNIVYEGEVFNIKVDGALKKMSATSGASVNWSCASDCVKVTNDVVGHGCQMEIIDCQFNNNKLLNITLFADVTYSKKKKNGTYVKKKERFKEKIKLHNEVDAIEPGEFIASEENTYKDGVIVLTSKNKVMLDVILNQGEEADTASRQKMKYFISDQYGFPNTNGKKIAKVNAKGQLTGVGAGVTYLSVAPSHLYNKYANTYDYMLTIPVVCPEVNEVAFNFVKTPDDSETALSASEAAIKAQMDSDRLTYTAEASEVNTYTQAADGSMVPVEPDYILTAIVGSEVQMSPYLSYNGDDTAAVFNKKKMKQNWITSDPTVASVNKQGKLKCKRAGFVEITYTPIGGFRLNAETGKLDSLTKPCSSRIMIKVIEDPANV